MTITPALDKYLHEKLPIDADERILSVNKRHPIVFVIPILFALVIIVAISSIALLLTAQSNSATPYIGTSNLSDYRGYVVVGIGIFSFLVLLFTLIPIWVKSQDRLILTDESVMQVLQTSLFSDKISQLSLQHVADVTVKAGFWGNLFGYGKITIETPGEQANYMFNFLAEASTVARQISEAHEYFIGALESGNIFNKNQAAQGRFDPAQTSAQPQTPSAQPMIAVSPEEYQKFVEFQQQQGQNNPSQLPPNPPTPPTTLA